MPFTTAAARFAARRLLVKWRAGRVLQAAILSLATLLSACGHSEKEYQKLVEENARLKVQLEKFAVPAGKDPAKPSDGPDLNLTMAELWDKRFEDINDFRATKLLSNKTMRISGQVESVTDDSVSIYGSSKRFGTIRMTIKLMPGYAGRVRNGLALLEKGATVSVQGKFVYERMGIEDAVFVDPKTGRTLYTENLAIAGAEGTPSGGVPPADGSQPK
jgi:hypothetical protein